MSQSVDHDTLGQLIAARLSRKETIVAEIVDATLEEIYQALKRGECVSLKNFGTFYVSAERESWVFKFNPSRRRCALFGWSSTYKGNS